MDDGNAPGLYFFVSDYPPYTNLLKLIREQ